MNEDGVAGADGLAGADGAGADGAGALGGRPSSGAGGLIPPAPASDGGLPRHRSGWTLWSDGRFVVTTPAVPHLPPEEGCHVLVQPLAPPPHAWADPPLTGAAFELAARVCRVMEALGLAPWFNLQANGNWGLLPGTSPHFHIHVYGRRRGSTWGQPVRLPLAPGTFAYPPLAEEDRARLAAALRAELADRYGPRDDPYATGGLEAPPPRDA